MITNINDFRKKVNENHMDFQEPVNSKEVTIHLVAANDDPEHLVYGVFHNDKLIKSDFEDTASATSWATENGFKIIITSDTDETLKNEVNNIIQKIDDINNLDMLDALNTIIDKYCGGYDSETPTIERINQLSAQNLSKILLELNELYNTLPAENNSPTNSVKLRDALQSLLKKPDQTFIDMYIKGYNLHSGGASKPDQDPQFLKRMVAESRSDIRYALSEFEEFYEAIPTEHFDKLVNDPEKLMSGVVAFANGNDVMDYVHLGESRKINEGQTSMSLPGITTQEQLIKKVSSEVQKAMDIFCSQQKIDRLTVSVDGNKLKCVSKIYKDDELGIFKHGIKEAQIVFKNGSEINLIEGHFAKAVWNNLIINYDSMEQNDSGINYDIKNDSLIIYDIAEAKFYTREDWFTDFTTEKKSTGYNTKRINENSTEPKSFYLLSSGSKVNTLKPEANELVSNNSSYDTCYILVKTQQNPNGIIVSGSGPAEGYGIKVGSTMGVFDDGNRTTRFPKSYRMINVGGGRRQTQHLSGWHGLPGQVIAIANNMEEIKAFPKGTYSLVVMK